MHIEILWFFTHIFSKPTTGVELASKIDSCQIHMPPFTFRYTYQVKGKVMQNESDRKKPQMHLLFQMTHRQISQRKEPQITPAKPVCR